MKVKEIEKHKYIKCDLCGRNISHEHYVSRMFHPLHNTSSYTIKKINDTTGCKRKLDVCHTCMEELKNYIKERMKTKGDAGDE